MIGRPPPSPSLSPRRPRRRCSAAPSLPRPAAHLPPPPNNSNSNNQVITPWDVTGGADGKVDYDKLIQQFGCSPLTPDLVARCERLTGVPAHPFLKRGVFFAHRCAGCGVDF